MQNLKCIQPPCLLYTQCKYDVNFMIEVKILRKTHKICHHTVYFVHKSVGQSLALNSSRCWPAVKQFDSSFNYRQHLFCVERMIYSFANIQQFPSLIRIFHSNPFFFNFSLFLLASFLPPKKRGNRERVQNRLFQLE